MSSIQAKDDGELNGMEDGRAGEKLIFEINLSFMHVYIHAHMYMYTYVQLLEIELQT